MGDWISVKDKLPKDYEVVFIFPRPEDLGIRYAGLIDAKHGWQYYSDGRNKWFDCNVTHWMPIPDDPE